ncbi:MAG: hypothetical protein ACYCOO_06080 [Chitinophagaceae bacterium]
MEEMEQKWAEVEHRLSERFGKTPDMEAILFLIGIQELGKFKKKFTKEQKQDLIHVAVCSLLSRGGYFSLEGYDADGWPHFKELHPVPKMEMNEQEKFLKAYIIDYFDSVPS